MDKTMQDASLEAEKEITTEAEETEETKAEVETPEEVQETEASEPQDQVADGEESAEEGKSEEPTTTTEDFDPIKYVESLSDEKLTPEQKQQLKDGFLRQADYTRKTQQIANDRKILDEYSTLKPYIQKVFNDPKLYQQVFGPEGQAPQAENQEDSIPDDPREYAQWVQDKAVERAKAEIYQDLQAQNTEAAMEQDRVQASSLDPRLNTDERFARAIGGLVATDSDFIQGRKTATQATADALEEFKRQQEEYRSSVTKEYQTKAKAKSMVFPQTKSNSASASQASKAPSTMAEAAMMAEEELNA